MCAMKRGLAATDVLQVCTALAAVRDAFFLHISVCLPTLVQAMQACASHLGGHQPLVDFKWGQRLQCISSGVNDFSGFQVGSTTSVDFKWG